MEQNEFVGTEQGITDADLDEVERTFRFIFPKKVRSHYLRYNGGSPTNYLFKKDHTVFVIHEFLPVKYGKHLFEQSFRNLKNEAAVLPKHLVPFAVDPGGDYYCFSVRDKDVGSIWIYRGEYSEEPDSAVEYLAKSLDDFVGGMVADEA
jgi:hypothetical protein